jgi:hypothetical protein
MRDTLAANLDFQRWKYGTHEALAKKVKEESNWNDLHKFALGYKPIPASTSKAIESRSNLPEEA